MHRRISSFSASVPSSPSPSGGSTSATASPSPFQEGDELEIDVESGGVRNLTRGTELQGEAYTGEMLEIVEKGGLMKVLEERLGRGEGTPQ
jgi:hypothetical protein